MGQVKIEATIKKGDVYVRLGDVIKALLKDFVDLENHESAVKKYIKDSTESWEKYEGRIIKQVEK